MSKHGDGKERVRRRFSDVIRHGAVGLWSFDTISRTGFSVLLFSSCVRSCFLYFFDTIHTEHVRMQSGVEPTLARDHAQPHNARLLNCDSSVNLKT